MKVVFSILAAVYTLAFVLIPTNQAFAQASCGRFERKIATIERNIERTRQKQNQALIDTEAKEARYRVKQQAYLDAASALSASCQAGNQRACSKQQRLYAAYEKIEAKITRLWEKLSEKWEKFDQKIARFYEQLTVAYDRLNACQQQNG